MTYTYQNGNCDRSRTVEIEVFAEPSATFVPSSTSLCLGEFITIDDTNVDDVATWDYGVDGSINANGEVSWTSPGDKTIRVDVTTPALQGSCMNSSEIMVTVLDTLIFGEITCIDSDLDFVHFDWDDVAGATGYDISYTVDGGPRMTDMITDSEIIIDNLNPDETVSITVTAISPNQCPSVSRTAECTAVSCIPLDFPGVDCITQGIDFVEFGWDAVPGVTNYEIVINGNPIETITGTTYLVDGLMQGENVIIEVTALNDLANCPDVTRTQDCSANDCPEATITFNQVIDPCYEAAMGAITLEDPAITGVMGGGTGTWDSPYVVGDQFTPNPDEDMIYMLDYNYEEGTCTYTETFEVEVIIIPTASIDLSDDDICITETTTVESAINYINGEVAVWDFGTGVNATGSDFGPYELSFDAPGTYVITLSAMNDMCISDEATISIEVDPELVTPNISCTSTNSFVNFNWDDVEGVNGYNISIDGQFVTTQNNSDYRVENLVEEQEVEITIDFISGTSCELEPLVSTCITTACPAAFFDLDPYTTEMCLDGSQMSMQLNISLENGPAEQVTGTWSGPGVSPNGLFNPSGLGAQDVELTYSIEFSECAYDTSINILLLEAPQITAINPINPDCYQDNVGGLNPEVSGGTAPYQYVVDNLPPQDFPAFFDVIQPGLHTLVVTDAQGCTAELDFNIVPAQEPPIEIEGPGEIENTDMGEYTFNTTAQDIGNVIWTANGNVICEGTDCDPITILGADYIENGFVDLVVTVFFSEDCFVTATTRVDIFEIQKYYIPNVIAETAPNGNDRWVMFTKGGNISVESVRVYDRWGELVHVDESLEIDPDGEVDLTWDGTWTNDERPEVEQGVYVYVIEMTVAGRRVIESGDITVLR